jgi:tetratricopeptide (TPR) repeat protein
MFTTSLLLVLSLAAAPPSFEQLRAEGTHAYQEKNWKEACRAFQAAAQLNDKDAQNQADLGLCLAKLGRKTEAIAAQRKAVALGDDTLRRQAYYNLWKLGVKLPLPELPTPSRRAREPQCALVAKDACGAVHACTYVEDGGGSGGDVFTVGLMLGTDESDVQRAAKAAFHADPSAPAVLSLPLEYLEQYFCREMDYCRHLLNEAGEMDEAACAKELKKCDGKPRHRRLDCVVVSADACSGRVGGVCGKKAFELPGYAPGDP